MSASVFEIIGPIMIGPSSSHTAGMARIGMMVNRIADEDTTAIHLDLSPKLRATYVGHRSDAALIGGAIGMEESDPRIRQAIEIAHDRGIKTSVDFLPEGQYPQNSALLTVTGRGGQITRVLGTSIGGGSIVISGVDDVALNVSSDAYHLIIWSRGAVPSDLLGDGEMQSGSNGRETVSCVTYERLPDQALVQTVRGMENVRRVSVVRPVLPYGVTRKTARAFSSCQKAGQWAREHHATLAETAIAYEMERGGHSREEVRAQMHEHLRQIKASVAQGEKGNDMLYGLTSGQDGPRMLQAIREKRTISGGVVPVAVARAIGVMEYNGAMGCIVAAPTAGSSGIVPGAMYTVQEFFGFSDEQIVDALFVAALIGVIMAEREVSFSGSVGGCQGEVGVSSAITAAGLTSLFTTDVDVIFHAMAMCMKNLLGLVCDPIAGPVEVPCIKRNAVGVANAFTSADMALSGIRSYIPPDEVIDALVDVEKRLPNELKCATIGGLACTKTACELRKKLDGKER